MKENKLIEIPVILDTHSVITRLGNTSRKKISSRIRNAVDQAIEDIFDFARGEAYCEIHPYPAVQPALSSRKIGHIMRYCREVAVFIVTLGDGIDYLINEQMQKKMAYGYILDQAASLAAENAAGYIQKKIAGMAPPSAALTYRYSPGYCDWPLADQRILFNILDNSQHNVTLNEYALMNPRKSVSGIIGICPEPDKGFIISACSLCKNKCVNKRKESVAAYAG